jgi:hypothetical protein
VDSIFSPVILFFGLGVAAVIARSNLAVPEVVGKALALYLMAAIGLKGGVQVSESGFTAELGIAALAGLGLSLLLPLPVFWMVRKLGKLDSLNAGAVAAHYGSVSVVTFVTGVEILTASGMPPAGYMVAVLALMEAPAIIVGLWLARRATTGSSVGVGHHISESLRDGTVMLLMGSFAIGLVIGRDGFAPVQPVFEGAFRGMLCLFLLDMGLVAARQLFKTRSLTPTLALLAIGFAVVNGVLGVVLGSLLGLDAGTAAALGVLSGSASYIAAPAAIRLALPEADIGLPLAMSLAITFPYNVLIGIPLLGWLAQLLA